MAQSKGRKKTAAAKKSSTRGKRAAEEKQKLEQKAKLQRDISVLILLVVCILIFLSTLGAGGVAGRAVGSLFFGLFGIPAYAFPFLLFYLVVFLLANEMNSEVVMRVVGLVGLYTAVCTFFQVILYGYLPGAKLTTLYLRSAADNSGGGILGAVFVQLFGALFGLAGVYVIDLAAMVLFAILLTQKPLLSALQEQSAQAYGTKEERRAIREQKRAIREERNEALRVERERERLILERRLKRQEEARERSAIARQVIPQTITSDTGKTNVAGKGVSPITAGGLSAVEEKIDIADAWTPDDNTASRAASSKRTSKKAGIFDEAESYVQNTAGNEPLDLHVSPEDIPDDIISNGAVPQVKEVPVVPAEHKDERTDAQDLIVPSNKIKETDAGQDVETEERSVQDTTADTETHAVRKGKPSIGTPEEIKIPEQEETVAYVEPPLDLIDPAKGGQGGDSNTYLKETAAKLKETLHTFGVEVTINHISCGPTVTRYELTPQMGVKVSKILGLQDDIKLNLAASDIRIEAPIPGKAAIGIEVPNKSKSSVNLRELMETDAFQKHKSKLAFCVGKDIGGQEVIADIAKMPHLLIAGATGSGKSVFINTLIMSLIYKARPDEVKFIMIDPKVVELSVYNGIPHMLIPVVTDPKKAAGALNWAVAEMTDRYQKFAELGVRDLNGYNAKLDTLPEPEEGAKPKKMSRLVVIVDELADLMMVAQNEVEDSICRLAQLARAAGIHLVIATQRPSVNVITGLIKANMPSRVALSVTSGVDSRTIIDMNGAEKLLGNGDMLFYPQGYQKPARVQGAFLSDDEIARVCKFLKSQQQNTGYQADIQSQIESHSVGSVSPSGDAMDNDEYFTDAAKMIIQKDKASIGMLQRAFRIGFNRAARIMDQLYEAGVVGAEEGTKPRKILMTMEQFENYLEEN